MNRFEFTQQLESKNHQYSSANKLISNQNILKAQASLVSIKEINHFHKLVARAALGDYFLIEIGDCAENLYDGDQGITFAKLDFIQQVAEFIERKTGNNVIQVSRIAGRFAKPRNISQSEKSYPHFGDTVDPFHRKNRIFDPCGMPLNSDGSASVYSEMNQWNQELKEEQKIYSSHEALLLYFEHALTQLDTRTGLYYNPSTHFTWLDNRNINSIQHIDYLKKIANPIAIQIGADTSIPRLIKTINTVDPDYIPGRITLIPRLGVQQVHRILPQLIDAVQKTNRTVLWSCDPMYGNTETLNSGIKIRKLSKIVEEIQHSFMIHKKLDSQLNAIHLDATHQDVTECIDYNSSLCNSVIHLKKNYTSLVVPRLNYSQTMHVMQCIAKKVEKRRVLKTN